MAKTKIKGKTILLTGGSGFLGKFIVKKLKEKKPKTIFIPRSNEYDLVDMHQCRKMMRVLDPDIVIHSAALYGGIWINRIMPGEIYYKNLVMGANVIEAAREIGVEKFIGIGTACSYPGYLEGELKEENLWDGPCHESVRNYGSVKKMMQIQCEVYKKQYEFNGIHLLLANLYGPGDSYSEQRSHVVAALIRKFCEAKWNSNDVRCWGTGKPIREFLYVEDAAEGIVKATELYNEIEPLNIGTGIGTSIRELVDIIVNIVGYTEDDGKIIWDDSKPDGQYKKIFNIDNMITALNFWKPTTDLKTGLKKTIDWFDKNYHDAIKRW